MHPIFPDLLFLGPYFAPAALRLGVALYFLLHAFSMWKLGTKKSQLLSGKEAVFGLLIAAGFLTQLVALLGILVVLLRSFWLKGETSEPWHEKLLAALALAALAMTGPGAFAVDLPY